MLLILWDFDQKYHRIRILFQNKNKKLSLKRASTKSRLIYKRLVATHWVTHVRLCRTHWTVKMCNKCVYVLCRLGARQQGFRATFQSRYPIDLHCGGLSHFSVQSLIPSRKHWRKQGHYGSKWTKNHCAMIDGPIRYRDKPLLHFHQQHLVLFFSTSEMVIICNSLQMTLFSKFPSKEKPQQART